MYISNIFIFVITFIFTFINKVKKILIKISTKSKIIPNIIFDLDIKIWQF